MAHKSFGVHFAMGLGCSYLTVFYKWDQRPNTASKFWGNELTSDQHVMIFESPYLLSFVTTTPPKSWLVVLWRSHVCKPKSRKRTRFWFCLVKDLHHTLCSWVFHVQWVSCTILYAQWVPPSLKFCLSLSSSPRSVIHQSKIYIVIQGGFVFLWWTHNSWS